MEVSLSPSFLIAHAILALYARNGRKTVTINEYNIFVNNLKEKGIYVVTSHFWDVRVHEEFENFFDEIHLEDGKVLYSLKPILNIQNLEYNFIINNVMGLKINSFKDIADNLNDYTLEEERNIKELQMIIKEYEYLLKEELKSLETQMTVIHYKLSLLKEAEYELNNDLRRVLKKE